MELESQKKRGWRVKIKGHTDKPQKCSVPLSRRQGVLSTLDSEYCLAFNDKIDASILWYRKRHQISISEASADNITHLKNILMLPSI